MAVIKNLTRREFVKNCFYSSACIGLTASLSGCQQNLFEDYGEKKRPNILLVITDD